MSLEVILESNSKATAPVSRPWTWITVVLCGITFAIGVADYLYRMYVTHEEGELFQLLLSFNFLLLGVQTFRGLKSG